MRAILIMFPRLHLILAERYRTRAFKGAGTPVCTQMCVLATAMLSKGTHIIRVCTECNSSDELTSSFIHQTSHYVWLHHINNTWSWSSASRLFQMKSLFSFHSDTYISHELTGTFWKHEAWKISIELHLFKIKNQMI